MKAFWLDWAYDRRNGDPGTPGRYANYLRARRDWFDIDYDDPTSTFAATAWRIASGPIMSPPLIQTHPRILSAEVHRSEWNGELAATVSVVLPWPAVFSNGLLKGGAGQLYRGWQTSYGGDFEPVGDVDLENNRYLLGSGALLFQLPADSVPLVMPVNLVELDDIDTWYPLAVRSLEFLVDRLNREVQPILDQLDNA